jgi:hypothetical protein
MRDALVPVDEHDDHREERDRGAGADLGGAVAELGRDITQLLDLRQSTVGSDDDPVSCRRVASGLGVGMKANHSKTNQ